MKVCIAGWYGSDNLGDEILLSSLIDALRSTDQESSICVFCPNPDRVEALHEGVRGLRLPVLCDRQAAAFGAAAFRELRTADLFVVGPGTVLQEQSSVLPYPGTLPLVLRMVLLSRAARTPVAFLGTGVGEVRTRSGKGMVKTAGALSAYMLVRDDLSAQQLSRRAKAIGDLAYIGLSRYRCPTAPSSRGDGQPRTLAVSARPLGPPDGPLMHKDLQDALTALRSEWNPMFIPMALGTGASGENDLDYYWQALRGEMAVLRNPLEGEGTLGQSLDHWMHELQKTDAMVGMRLHALVASVALGIPTVALAYEAKVSRVFEQLGLRDFVVRPGAGGEAIVRTLVSAVGQRERFIAASDVMAETGNRARQAIANLEARVLA